MSSTNISGRSTGCISIPIEIIPSSSNSKPSSSSFQTFRHDYPHSDFSYSPPKINRFQPRQSPLTAYDRLIKNSQFYERPLYQSSNTFYHNPSNEDLLSSSRSNVQPKQNLNFRLDSDFIQSNKLHNFPDNFVPINQENIKISHDRSHSPASQRDESPGRPPPSSSSQQQQESDFKIPKDGTGSDQQVPSTEMPPRDPNIIALEKLEQIKQNLASLSEQVDVYIGSTRDDRQYRELDEQALKLMLSCDELIDVSSDIKEKRKEMIQNVQTVVTKLESKVPINSSMESNSNELVIYDPSINSTEQPKDDISIEQST